MQHAGGNFEFDSRARLSSIVVTLPVSKVSSWLNTRALLWTPSATPENMSLIVVTLAVSRASGWLNPEESNM